MSGSRSLSWLLALLVTGLLGLTLLMPLESLWAASIDSFPQALPEQLVIDSADLLSRAASSDISRALEALRADRVDARLITVDRLDYGLSLPQLGQQLLERWGAGPSEAGELQGGQLLLLIDGQTKGAAIVASPSLAGQLDAALLRSTARTTMAQPLRDGARYRQASLDALHRLQTVLEGGEDPGEPVTAEVVRPASNIPSREETRSSNALTWVVVLVVVGSVVPMLTWWIFSR